MIDPLTEPGSVELNDIRATATVFPTVYDPAIYAKKCTDPDCRHTHDRPLTCARVIWQMRAAEAFANSARDDIPRLIDALTRCRELYQQREEHWEETVRSYEKDRQASHADRQALLAQIVKASTLIGEFSEMLVKQTGALLVTVAQGNGEALRGVAQDILALWQKSQTSACNCVDATDEDRARPLHLHQEQCVLRQIRTAWEVS